MNKKALIYIALGVLMVAVMGFAGFKLFGGVKVFNEAEKNLNDKKRVLQTYYNKNPFPSPDNNKILQGNTETLNKWYMTLVKDLRKGEVSPVKRVSPAQFKNLLDEKQKALLKYASDAEDKVIVFKPAEFALGFDKYFAAGSKMPHPTDVPRLGQQLIIVDRICRMLIEEHITELTAVKREIFEGRASAATATRGSRPRSRPRRRRSSSSAKDEMVNPQSGLIPGKELYGKMRFKFDFKCRESELINIINRLAEDPMFAVVHSLSVKKKPNDVVMLQEEKKESTTAASPFASPLAAKPDETPAETAESAELPKLRKKFSREGNRVSGGKFEKPMEISMVVDVYRFKKAGAE